MDSAASSSQITTLFVADVPPHLQEREFAAAFATCDGFIAARLRHDRNDNVVGFVDFSSYALASRAKDRFQDYKFSPLDQGIVIQFSHGSSRSRSSAPRASSRSSTSNSANSSAPTPVASSSAQASPQVTMMVPDFYSPFPHSNYASGGAFPSYFMQQPFGQSPPPSTVMYALPHDACSTLYVEGLPMDATEREVAHIFRPWAGFQSLRILPKESKQYPNRVYNLCFVEFDNKYQSTVAMNALQGYKMDKNDTKGLHISYAKTERKERARVNRNENHTPLPGRGSGKKDGDNKEGRQDEDEEIEDEVDGEEEQNTDS